jgi:hypothetical protein
MAGSYRHITDSENRFIGTDLIENIGDAHEALEECYLMIQHLSGSDKQRIFEAWRDGYIAKVCPSNVPGATFADYWGRDEEPRP